MITVADLKRLLDQLPDDTVIVQTPKWEEVARPIETLADLGWHFSNPTRISWVPDELLIPFKQFSYYPTFRWIDDRLELNS